MAKVEYVPWVAPDGSFARIEVKVDGELKAWSHSSPEELSALIHALGEIRMNLAEEVPRELDPGSRVPTIEDPNWRMMHIPETNAVRLALRHPGFGWLAFDLPAASWEVLRDELAKYKKP